MAVYLFLDSRDSTVFHPSNTPDDFLVTLPKTYLIDDSWECAILELNIETLICTMMLVQLNCMYVVTS